MADYDSSLPIRSEADGADERVHVKVVDGVTPSQRMAVDSDLNAHVEVHGNNPAGSDEVLRMSEQGSASVDGEYHAANNSDPSQVGLVGMVRNAVPADSQQTLRVTAVANGAGDRRSVDMALHDSDGEAISVSNPVPVYTVEGVGTEVHEFLQSSAVAAAASASNEYSIADTVVFTLKQIRAAASGKMKVEVFIGDGAGAEAFTLKFVGFNSTANPNVDFTLAVPMDVVGTVNTTTIRVTLTNLDNQAQDLYSTIIGVEN